MCEDWISLKDQSDSFYTSVVHIYIRLSIEKHRSNMRVELIDEIPHPHLQHKLQHLFPSQIDYIIKLLKQEKEILVRML